MLDRAGREDAADNWRLERIAVVERNILRIGHPRAAHGATCRPRWPSTRRCGWRTGSAARKAPAFVNGVLDRVAHTLGRL